MSPWRIPGLDAIERLHPRDRRALRIGLTIIVPAAVIVLGVRPYRAALTETRERLEAERDALDRELDLIRSEDALPASILEAELRAEAVDLRFLDAPSLVLAEADLTDLLESRAVRSRVLLSEIESTPPARGEEPPPEARTLRLTVAGESDLEGVMTFLDGLESAMLLIRIRGLALEPVLARPQGGGDQQEQPRPTGVVQFQLIIESYVKDDAVDETVAFRSQERVQ